MRRYLKRGFIAVGTLILAWAGWDFYRLSIIQADLSRALTPVWRIPLQDIQAKGSASFECRWPGDEQWLRIANAWKSPSFVIACFKTPSDRKGEYVGLSLHPLKCRVSRQGSEIQLVGHEMLSSYPEFVPSIAWFTKFSGLEFRAEPGDSLTIEATLPMGQSLPSGMLVVTPYLNADCVKDIGVGNAIVGLIAAGKTTLGVILLVTGIFLIFWDRRKERRISQLPASI